MLAAIETVFGGDVPLASLSPLQVGARATLIYVAGLLIVRAGKSRMLSGATPLDVILSFMLGSLLSRGITGSASITSTVVACAALVALHGSLTWVACRWHGFGDLLKGHAVPLIRDGELLEANLRRSHISGHDLHEALRLNGNVDDPTLVKAAFKERSGEIGVVRRSPEPRILEIAVTAGVQTVRIELV